MNNRPVTALLIQLSLWTVPVAAVEQAVESAAFGDATSVAQQVYFVDHFYAFNNLLIGYQSSADMLLLSRSGESISVMQSERMITHQPSNPSLKTQDLVIFKSGKLRGTGILVDDYKNNQPMQIRMWLPSLRKIRRFSEPALDDIWGGSHLTYGDLYLRRPEHEKHQFGELLNPPLCLEDIESFGAWITEYIKQPTQSWCGLAQQKLLLLKSSPLQQSPWYDYRLRLIDAQTFAEYQVEYFKDQQLVKRIQKNWHSAGLADPRAQIWNFWTVKLFADGSSVAESVAWINDSSYRWNHNISAKLWSEKSLRKIRR